jgi:hypothetical protein
MIEPIGFALEKRRQTLEIPRDAAVVADIIRYIIDKYQISAVSPSVRPFRCTAPHHTPRFVFSMISRISDGVWFRFKEKGDNF